MASSGAARLREALGRDADGRSPVASWSEAAGDAPRPVARPSGDLGQACLRTVSLAAVELPSRPIYPLAAWWYAQRGGIWSRYERDVFAALVGRLVRLVSGRSLVRGFDWGRFIPDESLAASSGMTFD